MRVRGVRTDAAVETPIRNAGFEDVVRIGEVRAVEVGAVRGAELHELEVAPDQVVELELDGGVRLWTSVSRLQETLVRSGQRGSAADDVLVPAQLRLGSATATRGAGEWILRALKLIDVDVAGATSRAIVERLERALPVGPGLYRCAEAATLAKPREKVGSVPSGQPVLIFFHGTASSTSGSFGGLVEPASRAVWDRLVKRYGERMFAFEHRSLSESPVRNALELMERLPEHAVLHVVSHSRGGLIGELLARAGRPTTEPVFDDVDLAPLRRAAESGDDDAATELKDLEKLGDVLARKRPGLERYARVACPARGTLLASGRLDFYLSAVVNVVGLIPGLRDNPVYDFLTSLLLAVAKKRTEPGEIPGLAAMMPTAPLIRMLNRPDVSTAADLSVIAGDAEGGGVPGRLKLFATDLFFRENHDLVVNTAAMTGGVPRAGAAKSVSPGGNGRDGTAAANGGARYFFAKGADVDHFHYFRNIATADRVYLALSRADGEDAGFEPITEATAEQLKTRAPVVEPAPGTRPVVFILPGIMGSELAVERNRFWVDLLDLARGRMTHLGIDAAGVEPVGLIHDSYARIVDFLRGSHEVIEFPYDWRLSVATSADRLADAVTLKLAATPQPVRILAHSMGGLVARALIARRPDVWRAVIARDGGRLVMLGTPNGGSYVIPRVLLGQERVLRYLVLLDLTHGQRELIDVIRRFPGMLELLPVDPEHDFFTAPLWQELRDAWDGEWLAPDEPDVIAARGVLDTLNAADLIDAERVRYVAGHAPATPIGYRIDTGRRGRDRIQFLATARGDGRVPWSTGMLEGVRTWYMDAVHGDMANHAPAFAAIRELLERGTTTLLPEQPPAGARGIEEPFVLPAEDAVMYPDARELAAAVAGVEPHAAEAPREAPLAVSVSHGNLAFAPEPVAVGHYAGDTIAGAERVLDRQLGGWLEERRALNLYPGPIETAEVFLRPDARPGGAIVVGLGDVGSLTAARLERTFTHAVLEYAAKVAEQHRIDQPAATAPLSAGITTLLIGSGRGGISVEDSLRALINGALGARRTLATSALKDRVRLDRLNVLELYEDLAILAARAIQRMAQDERTGRDLAVEPLIRPLPGGRRRITFEEDPTWWGRLQVVERDDGALSFNSLTDRARAEVRLLPTQRALVDSFVADAIARVDNDAALAGTLFELLVPNDLKDYAPDQGNIVLLVDENTAHYPWELLQDTARGAAEPQVVRAGLIRQLATETFRRHITPAGGDNVLVVGDPPSAFPALPGAQKEAARVAEVLGKAGYTPNTRIRSGFREIMQALYDRPYRILHLAGHGVYDQELPPPKGSHKGDVAASPPRRISGMVLGTNVFLTPAEIEQMRSVPELVFINCCHLGRIEADDAAHVRDRHRLAANLATQLIRMGVRAVIAAGWAVQDDAGVTFARSFYDHMVQGYCFGDAVLAARKETYHAHPAYNTWGAYQCYGDPGYRLKPSSSADGDAETASFACIAEAVARIENLAQDAETAAPEDRERMTASLEQLEKALPPRWFAYARIPAALGAAYGQLQRFDRAIASYERAIAANDGEYTVRMLEQLANLRARDATRSWREAASAAERKKLRDEVRATLELLENLPGPDGARSVERSSLLGSTYKRLSSISTGKQRLQALENMAAQYRIAHERALRDGSADFYPLQNLLAAHVALHLLGREALPTGWRHWADQAEQAAAEKERISPDFWSGVARADGSLIRHLALEDLADHTDDVVRLYTGAWQRGGSPAKMRSVIEQLDWLLDCTTTAARAPRRNGRTAGKKATARIRETEAALRDVRDRVAKLAG